MNEKNFITSGRNTIIHKNRKFDLLVVNGNHPVVIVGHASIELYNGVMPVKRSEAKKAYQELVDVSMAEVFGEENGVGARSAVGMGALPGNITTEVEVILEIDAG